jgi:low affinity Fe/Cu permease
MSQSPVRHPWRMGCSDLTETTIVTILMVFLIQNTRNRDGERSRPSWAD